MHRADDLPRVRPFPVPTAWEPFSPRVEVRLAPSSSPTSERAYDRAYDSDTVLEAAVKLFRADVPVLYEVLPEQSVERARAQTPPDLLGSPWVPDLGLFLFPYELDWPLARRGRAGPTKVRDRQHARLLDPTYDCGSFFAMYRTRAGVVRLCVGGRDPDECADAWHDVARWLRELRRGLQRTRP